MPLDDVGWQGHVCTSHPLFCGWSLLYPNLLKLDSFLPDEFGDAALRRREIGIGGFKFDKDYFIIFKLDAVNGRADKAKPFRIIGVVFQKGHKLLGHFAVARGKGIFSKMDFPKTSGGSPPQEKKKDGKSDKNDDDGEIGGHFSSSKIL